MKRDRFFDLERCERCGGDLKIRTMSWFTDQTICLKCSDKETEIKRKLREAGLNPDQYEGIGYIPKV